jgi:hypothetical protein
MTTPGIGYPKFINFGQRVSEANKLRTAEAEQSYLLTGNEFC